MENGNLFDLIHQSIDSVRLLQKFKAQSGELADIKRKLMNLQMQYQLLRIKYDQICSATALSVNIGHIQDYKAHFASVEWHKTVSQLKRHHQNQIDQLKHKYQVNSFNREEHTANLKEINKKIQSQQDRSDKQVQSLEKMNLELTKKVQQKSRICKILMAKIHSLESSQINKQNNQNQINRTTKSHQHLNHKSNNQQITSNPNIVQHQTLVTLKTTLLNQLTKDFFQIFLKSFDPDKNQPSITIFQSNLNNVDTARMKPFCQCLDTLLSITKIEQIRNKTDHNQRQRWVQGYLRSLMLQRDKRRKDKSSTLIYVFRLAGLYYRINSSLANEEQISSNLINEIEIQLFKAFSSFFYS